MLAISSAPLSSDVLGGEPRSPSADDSRARQSGSTETGFERNEDEKANARYFTEVAVPELERWNKRSTHCRFVVINDIHLSPGEPRELPQVILRLNKLRPDFVVFLGDLNNSQSAPDSEIDAAFKTLFEVTANHAEFPCYYGMGNTDVNAGADSCEVFRRWAKTKPYYSFDHGGMHFVMLYTEKDKPERFGIVSSEQLHWLEEDLKEQAIGMPVVLFGHHALYEWAGKWEKDNWGIENSAQLLALLRPFHLVATFSGHRHLNRMSLDERHVLHVINGPMVGDHSDDIGPKQDGKGYRWVTITNDKIHTTWIQIGTAPISP